MRPTVSLLTLGSILLLGGGPVAAAPEEWACDLRAWTRAPDLSPGLSTLAEARLAGNGTACNEIDRWEVGLRFKERAIIKLRARNVGDFPAKPTRAPFNATSHPRPDWNDIYLPQNTWFDSNDDSYKEAMEKYNAAIRDKSLWEVHGDERVVFDIKQELPIDGSGDTELDVVAPFFVHVPLTNFPPMESMMLNTETMFEYYHLIHLKNGTTIDIPAGRAGFLPHPTPATPSWRACEVCAKDWPRSMELHSPRLEEDRLDKEMGLGMYGPRAPKCDAGNLANFSLEVTSDTPYAVQGKNISLHIKLTRTGNGSEYPAYLDLTHALARNVTWAYRFVSSVEEYAALTSGDHGALRFSSHPRHRPSPGRMLMITTQRELEEQRNREEAQRERGFGGVSYSSGRGGRWPLGNNQARYDFEESGDEYVDVYEFDVELPIRHDDMPSFVKTFENLESVIDLDLHTTFLCDRDNEPEGASDTSAGHRSASDERDAEWKEYSLPLRPANRTISSRSGLSHRGSITLDMRLANLSSSLEEGQDVAHYLDTEARSPILSSAASRPGPAAFPALGSSLRPENKAELVKSRYGPSEWRHMRRDRCKSENRGEGCWKLNGGGAWMHAAKLWQGRRDEAERVQPESYDVELGQPGLVIQT